MGRVEKSMEVNAPVDACYEMWTDFENFPKFMKHVQSVKHTGADMLHWVVDAPLGNKVEWDAEVKGCVPNQSVSWRSVEGAHVDNAGAVTFDSLSNDRTRVNVNIEYSTPGGIIGEIIGDIFSNPTSMVEEDLKNFKELVEQRVPAGVGARSLNNDMDTLPNADRESFRGQGDILGSSANRSGIVEPGNEFNSL